MQEVSGLHTSPFLDTDELKMDYGPEKSRGFRETGPTLHTAAAPAVRAAVKTSGPAKTPR